ncbi:hypothetical protein SAMN04487934_1158 [Eubacterium ruminantium]|nr:hypothetical protein SAMN04487934_1158 [Eubacterium ruminantium]
MKKNSVIKYLLPSILIILIINISCCFADYCFELSKEIFTDIADRNGFVTDLFLVEIQITFIVLSLATVLSTQTKPVYWEDIFQYRLIKPKFWNFTAITSYILATMIDGVVIMIADKCMGGYYFTMGIISSFLISLILMSILSVRMIGANFGREELKKELEESLRDSIKSIQKVNEHIGFDKGLRIPQIRQLVQVTIQELEEKKIDLACENMDLLFRFGFYQTLNRCYKYAIDSSGSASLMDEVNYSLMHNALQDNRTDFFASLFCPIPFESQVILWDDIIYDEFDKAAVLFRDGKKEEAFKIRYRLFDALLLALSHTWQGLPAESTEYPEEHTRYQIIMLMATFVNRRMQYKPFEIDGKMITLEKDWETNEREMEGYDRDNVCLEDLFLPQVNETLDRWLDIDDDFLCDRLYLDWEQLGLARKF